MIGTLEELEAIYKSRHQYSIEWAFKNAQEKLNNMTVEFIHEYQDEKCSEIKAMRRNKWYTRIFHNTLGFITILEFILSVLLVYFISEMSHVGQVFLQSRGFSISVILVFAFIKVFLEQYYLKPRIESFGWKLYKGSVENVKNYFSK